MNGIEKRFRGEFEMVFDVCLKCRVDWISKHGKIGEKHTFWALFGDLYRYILSLYRYNFGSGHFLPTCTGTS